MHRVCHERLVIMKERGTPFKSVMIRKQSVSQNQSNLYGWYPPNKCQKKFSEKTLNSKKKINRERCKDVLKIVYHHFCIISEQVSSTTSIWIHLRKRVGCRYPLPTRWSKTNRKADQTWEGGVIREIMGGFRREVFWTGRPMERDYFCENEICCANNDPNMPKWNGKINARSCIGIIAKKQDLKQSERMKNIISTKKETPRDANA